MTEPTWQDQTPASSDPVERARRDLRLSGDERIAVPATAPPGPPSPPEVLTPSADLRRGLAALRAEVGKAVVGQDAAVTGLVIALLCRGHVLL
ncbi:MAG: MoxR family ATPase, partial [Actinotalea sp.]|nr:MoxR family ATPase [Actinotalea sp.]